MLRLASALARRRALAHRIGVQAANPWADGCGVTAAAAAVAAAYTAAAGARRFRSSHTREAPRRARTHTHTDDADDDIDDPHDRWARPRSGVAAVIDAESQHMRTAGAAAAGIRTRADDEDDGDDEADRSDRPPLSPSSLQAMLDDALEAIAAEDARDVSRRREEWPLFAAHLQLLAAAIDGFAEAQSITPLTAEAARACRRDFFTWVQASAGTLWTHGAEALSRSAPGSASNARALLRYYHSWLEFSVVSMDSPRIKWTLGQIEHWDRVRNEHGLRAHKHASWLFHPNTIQLLLRLYQSLLLEVRSKAKDADATIPQTHLYKLMIDLPAEIRKSLPASHASNAAAEPEVASPDPPSTVSPEDAWLYPEPSPSSVTSALPHIHARIAELWALAEAWWKAAQVDCTQEDHEAFLALQQKLLQALQMSSEPGQPPSDALQALAAQLRSKPTLWKRRDFDGDSLPDAYTVGGDSVTSSFEVLIKQHSFVRPVPDLAVLADLLSKMRRQRKPTASVYNSLLHAALVVARHTMKMQALAPREVARLKLQSPLSCFEWMQRLLSEMRALQPNGKPLVQPNASTFIVLVNAHSLASLADVRAGFGQAAQHLPALLALYEDMLHTVASPHIRLLNDFLQSFARLESPQRPDLSLQIFQAILTHGELDASGTRQLRGLDDEGRVRWPGVVPNAVTFEVMLEVFARAGMVKQAVSCYALLMKLSTRPPSAVSGEESPKPTAASIQLLMQLLLRERDPTLREELRPMVTSLFADLTRLGLPKNLMHFTYTLRARIEMQDWAGVEALVHEIAFSSAPETRMALQLVRQPPVADQRRPLDVQFRYQAMEALVLADRVAGVKNAHNWLLPASSDPFYREFVHSGSQQVGGGFWRWCFYDYLGWLERAPSLEMFRTILSLMPRTDASCLPVPVGSLRLTDMQWSAVLTRLLYKNPLCASFGSWKRFARTSGRTDFRMDWSVFLSANAEYVASVRADPVQAELLERFPFELLCAEVKHQWLQEGFFGAQAATVGSVLQLGPAQSSHAHLYCEKQLYRRAGRISEWTPPTWLPVASLPKPEAAWATGVGNSGSMSAARTAHQEAEPQAALEQQLLHFNAEAEASARARAAAQETRKHKRDADMRKKQAGRPSIEPDAAAVPLSLAAAVEQAKIPTPSVVAEIDPPAQTRSFPVASPRPARRVRAMREPSIPRAVSGADDAASDVQPILKAASRTHASPTPFQSKQARLDAQFQAQIPCTLSLVDVPESFRASQLAAYLRPLAGLLDDSRAPFMRIHRSYESPEGAIVGFPTAEIARRVEEGLEAISSSAPDDLPAVMRAMQRHPTRIRTTPCTVEHVRQLRELSVVYTGKDASAAAHFAPAPPLEGDIPSPVVMLHGFTHRATTDEIGPFLKLVWPQDAPAPEVCCGLDAVLVRFPSTEGAQAVLDRIAELNESQVGLFPRRISGRFVSTASARRVHWPLQYPGHVLSVFALPATLPTRDLLEFLADHGLLQRNGPIDGIHARYCEPTPQTQTDGCWQVHFRSAAWLDSPWASVFLADNDDRPQQLNWRGMDIRVTIEQLNPNSPGANHHWKLIDTQRIQAVSHVLPLEAPLSSTLVFHGLPPAQFNCATDLCDYLNVQGYFPEHAEISVGVQVTPALALYARRLKHYKDHRPRPPRKPQDIVLLCGSKAFAAYVLHMVAQRKRSADSDRDTLSLSCRFLTSWPEDRFTVGDPERPLSAAELGPKGWRNRTTELAHQYPLMRKLNSRIVTFHGFADAQLAEVRACLSQLVPTQGELGMLRWSWHRVLLDVGSPDAVKALLAAAEKDPAAFSFRGKPLRLSRFHRPTELPLRANAFVRWKLPPLPIHASGQTATQPAVAAEDKIDDEEAFAAEYAPDAEAHTDAAAELSPGPVQVLPQLPPLTPASRSGVEDNAVDLSQERVPPSSSVAVDQLGLESLVAPARLEPAPASRREEEDEAAPQDLDPVSAPSVLGLEQAETSLEIPVHEASPEAAVEQGQLATVEAGSLPAPAEADPGCPPAATSSFPLVSSAATPAVSIVPGAPVAAEAIVPAPADLELNPVDVHPAVPLATPPPPSASIGAGTTVQPLVQLPLELPQVAVTPLSASSPSVSSPVFASPLVLPAVFASSFRVGIRFPSVLPQHRRVFVSRIVGVPGRMFLKLLDRTRTVAEVISVFQSRFESLGLRNPFQSETRRMLADEKTEVLLFPPLTLLNFHPDVAAKQRNQCFRIGFRFERALRAHHSMLAQEIIATVNRMVRVATEQTRLPDLSAEPPRSAGDSGEPPFGVREFFFAYAPLLIHLECHAALETLFLYFSRARQLYPALLCMHHLLHSKAHDGLDSAPPATASKGFEQWQAQRFVGLNPACYDRLMMLMRWSTAQLRQTQDESPPALPSLAAVASPFVPMHSLLHQLLLQYSSTFDDVQQRSYWGRQYCQLESASQALWRTDDREDGDEWRHLVTAWLEIAERTQAFMAQYRSSPFGDDMNKPPLAMPVFPLSVYATWISGARTQLDWITRASPMQIQAVTAAYLELISPHASVSPPDPATLASASMLLDATSSPGVSLLTFLGRLSAQLWRLHSQQTGEAGDAKLLQQAEAIFHTITLHAIRPSLLQDGNSTAQPIVLLACTRWSLEQHRRWSALSPETSLTRLAASKFVQLCKLLERIPSIDPIAVLHQRLFRVHYPITLLTTTTPPANDEQLSPLLLHALGKLKELRRSLNPTSPQSREKPKAHPGERSVALPVLSDSEPARRALIDSHIAVLMELLLALRSQESRGRARRPSSEQPSLRTEIAELVAGWAKMPSMLTAASNESSPAEYMLHALWKLHSSEQMQQRYAQATHERTNAEAPLSASDALNLSGASSQPAVPAPAFVPLSPVLLAPLLAVVGSCVPLSLSALRDLVLLAQHQGETGLHQMEQVVRIIETSMDARHAGASPSDVSALYHSVLRFYASLPSLSHVVALLELMRQRGVESTLSTFHSLLVAFNAAMDAHRNRSMGERAGGATGRGIGSAGSGAYDAQVQALYAAMTAHIRAHLQPPVVRQAIGPLHPAQSPRVSSDHRPTAETLSLLLHSALHSSSLAFAQTVWAQLTGLSRTPPPAPLSASSPSASSSPPLCPVPVRPDLAHLLLMLDVFEKHAQISPAVAWAADIGFTHRHAHTDQSSRSSEGSTQPTASLSPAASSCVVPAARSPVFVHSLLQLLSRLAPPLDARRARQVHQTWASAREAAQHDAQRLQEANETAEREAVDIVRHIAAHRQLPQHTQGDEDTDAQRDTTTTTQTEQHETK